ncbi:MAG: VCBS repeat-containing protein [Candidatus Hydrogenedentes bacterium]|nr:VCBS repeat-containing protein [Candidatus Hydrogenedentota bacterium]
MAAVSLVFVEQPIDGLTVGSGLLNTRHADLDGDGANDIITPLVAAFQRSGNFPKSEQTPLPVLGARPIGDVWEDELYVLLDNRIEVVRWFEPEWQRTLSQPIEWPAASGQNADLSANSNAIRFERFLRDLDGDGKPEIIRSAQDGLHIYAKADLFYELRTVWRVFQRPLARALPNELWPAEAREVRAPQLDAIGAVHLLRDAVQVVRVEALDSRHHRVRQYVYTYDTENSFALTDKPVRVNTSNTVDSGFDPRRLNDDETMDLVRVRVAGETPPPLTTPIVETNVSTDAGMTMFTVRSYGPAPRSVLVDYNHDGRIDILSETKRLVEGGIRETLVRGLTRKEVDLQVEVRFQDSVGAFTAKPSISHKFSIELDKPPASRSVMFNQFLRGNLFSLKGDFDGDGISDAAIRDRPNRLAVHKGQPSDIASGVLASLTVAEESGFFAADIDGDGRDDLVVTRVNRDGLFETVIHLSRESAP